MLIMMYTYCNIGYFLRDNNVIHYIRYTLQVIPYSIYPI